METNQNKIQLTPKQKQAAIVCIVCALALIITICVTAVQVSKAIAASEEDTSSSSSSTSTTTGYTGENYVIDATVNDAILTETEDMGDEYLDETLFIGDSNTVRFYNNGLLTTQQFCAMEGLTIQSALTEEFVTFKNDDELYTIAEAVAMMKPRRVIITLGTNNADGSMSTDAFVSAYENLINAILESYEYSDIIINSIPPVMEAQTSYPDLSQEVIDEMNMALAVFAQENGYKFLNSAEALKDSSGYGDPDYYVSNDIHLKAAGLNAILDYVTTHAYISEDLRPDTDNIAQRTSSSSSASGTTGSSTTTTSYTAKYFVDSAGGGTLTSGTDTGNANLSFDIDSKDDSVTVTAVPEDGYAFVKWSDDVTTATRTDTSFTQNVNVTAMFGAIGLSIELNTEEIKVGGSAEFEATVTGGYASSNDLVWYVNGEVNSASAIGKSWITIESNTDYSVYATVTYNGTTVTSETITITQAKTVEVPNITGMLEADAKTALTTAGLTVGTITYVETNDTTQQGYVTFQATAAGEEVTEESAINFTVGKAVTTYEVPNVVGETQTNAESLLVNFTNCTYITASSESVAAGTVMSQSVAAGNSVSAGTDITITVSSGPEMGTIPTGILMGTEDAAKSALSSAGFSNVTVTYTTGDASTSSTNVVTACSETEGSSVAKSKAITITVEAIS
ncbi:MAG: PASTA domain-containing protein [Faecalibacterium sp.]